jgi:hypothetical protein
MYVFIFTQLNMFILHGLHIVIIIPDLLLLRNALMSSPSLVVGSQKINKLLQLMNIILIILVVLLSGILIIHYTGKT